jgi:hypothetical protein
MAIRAGRAQRGVAYVAAARKDWPAARAALEPAEHTAAALVKAEPLWRQARYLHGATLYDLADVNRGEQHPDRATALATQARDEFVIGVKRAPGDLEFVRGLPIAWAAWPAIGSITRITTTRLRWPSRRWPHSYPPSAARPATPPCC